MTTQIRSPFQALMAAALMLVAGTPSMVPSPSVMVPCAGTAPAARPVPFRVSRMRVGVTGV